MPFLKNHPELTFSWNSCTESDWSAVKRLFVAAYFSSYYEASLDTLGIPPEFVVKAQELFQVAWTKAQNEKSAKTSAYEIMEQAIINPLLQYMQFGAYSTAPIIITDSDKNQLRIALINKRLGPIAEKFQKLLAIKLYFADAFEKEKKKILDPNNPEGKIQYLVAYWHDKPIAAAICQLHRVTAKTHLRWLTIAPSFQNEGLGRLMLDNVFKHFANSGSSGVELFTRSANWHAQAFYRAQGFKSTDGIVFRDSNWSQQVGEMLTTNALYPPIDLTVVGVEARNFQGFVRQVGREISAPNRYRAQTPNYQLDLRDKMISPVDDDIDLTIQPLQSVMVQAVSGSLDTPPPAAGRRFSMGGSTTIQSSPSV